MLTSTEVRKRLRIGRDKLRELIQSGELEAMKTSDAVNAPYRFTEEAVDEYIKSRKVQPEAVGQ